MKNLSTLQRVLLVALGLVAAGLACSAPSVQGGATPSADVAQVAPGAVTVTPFVVTATPETGGAAEATTEAPAAATTAAATATSNCGYDSLYIADLTVPDGSQMLAGTKFTKTWRVKNNGCAAWPEGTKLVYLSGDQMSAPSSVGVPQTDAGGTQDISIDMTASSPAGDYVGKWQMRTPKGVQFGDVLSVKITTTTISVIPGLKVTPHLIAPLFVAKFSASYAGAKKPCMTPIGTTFWVKVTNTGTLKFESSYLKLEAPAGSQVSEASNNSGFLDANSCSGTANSSLDASSSAWLLVGTGLTSIPSGTNAKITVTLCGDDNQGGTCVSKAVTFTTG